MDDPIEELQALRRDHANLARQHAVEVKLAETLGSGGRLGELFAVVAKLSGRPMWLLDADGAEVMSAQVPEGMPFPRFTAEHADRGNRTPAVESVSSAGIHRRLLVEQVRPGDVRVGWLAVAELPSPFGAFDRYLVRRAADYLARHHRLHRAIRESIADLGSDLADQLLRGAHRSEGLRRGAESLGIDVDGDLIVACVDDSAVSGGLASGPVLARRVAGILDCGVIGTRTHTGITLIVGADAGGSSARPDVVDRLKRTIAATIPSADIQVGISTCRPADHVADAYVEASEVLSCLERFPAAHSRVVTASELGPARVLVANGNIGSIRRYVRQTLGPLWDGSEEDRALLRTVADFVRTGYNVRRTAHALGVHENTVRSRIAKVRKLTGLDVLADPSDQLAAHTALTIVTLRDRPHPVTMPSDDQVTVARVSGRTA